MVENKKMEYINKIITNLVRIILLIFLVISIFHQDWKNVGILVITVVLTFYEFLVKRVVRIELDAKLKIAIILFIFGAQFLGTTQDWYGKFFWWDSMLHLISGVIFMYIGIAIVQEIDRMNGGKTNPIITVLFGFCFILAIGVFWEMFEFLVDKFLGGNMQRAIGEVGQNAIIDTMMDLASAMLGGILTSAWEIVQMKKGIENTKTS